MPSTDRIFIKFDPIIFPSDIPVCFFKAAVTEVANSGMLVPTATIDIDITRFEIPNVSAMSAAFFTSKSAPRANPATVTIKIINDPQGIACLTPPLFLFSSELFRFEIRTEYKM